MPPLMRPLNTFFLFIFSFVLLVPTTGFTEVVDRIVAVVNGDVITLVELEKAEQRLMHQLKLQNPASTIEREKTNIRTEILNQLIDQKLAEQEAKRLGLSVSEAEVGAAIEKIIQESGINKEQLIARLQQDGLTAEEYRGKIKDQIERFKLIGRAVNAKIVITENKLREYYQNNLHSYRGQQRYKVQHIVFSIPGLCNEDEKQAIFKKAEGVRRQAMSGTEFENLARRFSAYTTATEGGNLGYFDKSELAPYMRDIIIALKAGEISPVVETPIGYQIFKVADIEETRAKTFEEVKEEIYQILFEQGVTRRFMAWIKELRDRSYIEVLL